MRKFLKTLVYIMLITYINILCKGFNQNDDSRESLQMTRQFKMRCTRRYSPGVCANHVSPVWTYVFQQQNCTERLGCTNYFRSNRYKTFNICMRQCQSLAEVYLQMLEMEEYQDSSDTLRKRPNKSTLAIQARNSEDTSSPQLDLAYEDYEQGENETRSIVYKDVMNNYEIFPPNVDRVDGEIKSQYELLQP